ncbi:ACT domain-containing protein [Candidatus Micrarchaeota archaeon]|nr:ACT domain-containing protein [Candidatus Micrarchaeota archaeon]
MVGIKNLDKLLKEMKPELMDKEYVFCTISPEQINKMQLDPILTFKEKEGITVILERKTAEANSLPYSGVWKLITLTVHSDLSAVGFLARITGKLAKEGISVNAVSAYYHDHLFVPVEKADDAIRVLKEIAEK